MKNKIQNSEVKKKKNNTIILLDTVSGTNETQFQSDSKLNK